jgi:hypothetical protein
MYGRKTGGRKAGTPNKATAEIRQVAMLHGPAAIKRLAVLMKGSGVYSGAAVACFVRGVATAAKIRLESRPVATRWRHYRFLERNPPLCFF